MFPFLSLNSKCSTFGDPTDELKNKHDDRYAFLEFVLNDSIDQFLKDSRTLKDFISKLG